MDLCHPMVGPASWTAIVQRVKRLLLIVLAFVLVAIFASLKWRKRDAVEPEAPEGSWEPAEDPATS